MPKLISIQVGLPTAYGVEGTEDYWETAFFKFPVEGSRLLSKTQLEGDGQADLRFHGGPDKAVLAYSAENYPLWKDDLDVDFPGGAFGENFTFADITEKDVCIGDQYQLGEVTLEVSQPRVPCWKLSKRWEIEDLALQTLANGRSGWYFRVLKEGKVEPGLDLVLLERPYPQWTVAEANLVMHHRKSDIEATRALANCPALAESWQVPLARRASKSQGFQA